MMSLVYALDECSVSLPTYVSADLSRVPSVSPGEVDVFALATTVASLSEQLSNVRKRLEKAEAALTVKPGEFLSSCKDATGSDTVAKHSSQTTPHLAECCPVMGRHSDDRRMETGTTTEEEDCPRSRCQQRGHHKSSAKEENCYCICQSHGC